MMNTYSTSNENTYGVQALSHSEMQEIDGGLFPIVIFGVKLLSAKAVTSIFAAGVTLGAAGAVAALD